jgi:DNA repair exonuclease SbcCD ATPase subunit
MDEKMTRGIVTAALIAKRIDDCEPFDMLEVMERVDAALAIPEVKSALSVGGGGEKAKTIWYGDKPPETPHLERIAALEAKLASAVEELAACKHDAGKAAEAEIAALSARVEVLSGNLADAVEKYASQELELLSARSERDALKVSEERARTVASDTQRDLNRMASKLSAAEKRAEEAATERDDLKPRAERLAANLQDERDLGGAYLNLRILLRDQGAFKTLPGGTDRYAVTEDALRSLIAERDALKAELDKARKSSHIDLSSLTVDGVRYGPETIRRIVSERNVLREWTHDLTGKLAALRDGKAVQP